MEVLHVYLCTATNSDHPTTITSLSRFSVFLARLYALSTARFVCAELVGALFSPPRAQSTAKGTIAGRVSNDAAKVYVRNAEVRIDGANLVTSREGAGFYRLTSTSPTPSCFPRLTPARRAPPQP